MGADRKSRSPARGIREDFWIYFEGRAHRSSGSQSGEDREEQTRALLSGSYCW